MLPQLSYDWTEVFKYACFSKKDVTKILAMEEGENDRIGFFALSDGTFGVLRSYIVGFCVLSNGTVRSYTECAYPKYGSSSKHLTVEDAIRFGLTEEERIRLRIRLPPPITRNMLLFEDE